MEIGVFSECKSRRALAYGVKQILAQELESERLRRMSNATGIINESTNKEKTVTKTKTPENLKTSKKRNVYIYLICISMQLIFYRLYFYF